MALFTRQHRAVNSLGRAGLGLAIAVSALVAVPILTSAPALADAPTDTMPEASAVAQATGESVEVQSLTTETNRVTAQPDGTFELDAARDPVRTDINGKWEPIDTTLRENADGTHSPAATTLPVRFTAGGGNDAVTAGTGDDAITFSWDESDLPSPTVNGDHITYREVRPGVDLVFTATSTGYSDALVVKNPNAAVGLQSDPAEFTGTSTGMDLSAGADGRLVASNPETGTSLVSPPPLAWDSSGGGVGDDHPDADSSGTAKVHELPQTIVDSTDTATSSSVTLSVAPPAATLDDPSTKYPLYLDPQISGRVRTHYLTVHSKGWDYYDDTNQVMRVGYCGWSECNTSTQGDARSFFSFNVDSTLGLAGADPVIYDATVKVQQVWNASSSAQPVNLTKATSFSSSTNYPGPVGANLQQISSAAGYGGANEAWLSFSGSAVQNYVQDQATADANFMYFSLSAPSEGNKYYWKKFNSNPTLSVVFAYPPSITSYAASGVVACSGYPVYAHGSITFNVAASDPYTGYSTSQDYAYQAYHTDATNNGPWDSTTLARSSGWVSSNPYTLSTSTWPTGTYAWRVGVRDPVGVNDANGDPYPGATRYTDPATRPFTVDNSIPTTPTISSNDYPENYWGRTTTNPGSFTVSVPSDAVAVAYSFNGTPSLKDSDCAYTGAGFATPSGGRVTLTPTGLNPGVPNKLTLFSFDRAHNKSSTITYTFYPSPDYGTTTPFRTEAESSAVTKTPTGGIQVTGDVAPASAGPGVVSTLTSTDSAASVDYSLSVNTSGYYAVGVKLGAACSTNTPAQFTIPDAQVSAAVTACSSATDPAYVQLGGYQLSAGMHKLRVVLPNATSSTPSTFGIDYVTVAQIQGSTYGSAAGTMAANLSAAFNNHGIASEGGAGASLEPGTTLGLSRQQLAARGIVPGTNFTTSFLDTTGFTASTTFAIPSVPAGSSDNVISAGQHIVMPSGLVTDHVDFLVAATCAPANPTPRALFDLIHQVGSSTVTTNPGLPAPIPVWLNPTPSTDITAITSPSYVNGTTATAVAGTNSLYVIEVDVDPAQRSNPLTQVTLPSTGTSLTQACGAAPMLHVLAMTTRKNP